MDDACRERNEGAAAECSFHGDRCNFFSSNPASPPCARPASRPPPPPASQSPRFFAERESEFSKGNDLRYISKGVFAGARALSGGPSVCVSATTSPEKNARARPGAAGIKKPAGGGSPSRDAGERGPPTICISQPLI